MSPIGWKAFGAIAFATLFALVSRDAVAGISSRLVYSRSEAAMGCADERVLRASVAERLGYDPFVAHSTTTIVAEIFRDGRKLRARAHLVDASGIARGARELVSDTEDCRPLVAALALAISIALDPMSAIAPPSTSADGPLPEPEGKAPQGRANAGEGAAALQPTVRPEFADREQPPGKAERSTSPNTAQPLVRSPRSIDGQLRAGAFLSTGWLPAMASGASVQFGVMATGTWSVGIEGSAQLPASRSASTGDDRVRAWTWASSLVPCFYLQPAALCGLATVGQIVASGEGVANSQQKTAFYVALGGRAVVAWKLAENLAVELHGDLFAPMARHRLSLNGNDIWQAPALGGALGSGIVFRPW